MPGKIAFRTVVLKDPTNPIRISILGTRIATMIFIAKRAKVGK